MSGTGRGGYRAGAGRPVGSTKKKAVTKTCRVPVILKNERYQDLPDLLNVITYWEDELNAARERGESLRTYEKLAKLIEEVKLLGYLQDDEESQEISV
jgi:hypothetical protein